MPKAKRKPQEAIADDLMLKHLAALRVGKKILERRNLSAAQKVEMILAELSKTGASS